MNRKIKKRQSIHEEVLGVFRDVQSRGFCSGGKTSFGKYSLYNPEYSKELSKKIKR